MENWISLEVCNSEENQQLAKMYYSGDNSNKELAIEISKNSGNKHWDMYTDEDTVSVLMECGDNFEYIGVRISLPNGHWGTRPQYSILAQTFNKAQNTSRDYQKSDVLWNAVRGKPGAMGCGNSLQYQIKEHSFSKGLYRNIEGKWYKRIIW